VKYFFPRFWRLVWNSFEAGGLTTGHNARESVKNITKDRWRPHHATRPAILARLPGNPFSAV